MLEDKGQPIAWVPSLLGDKRSARPRMARDGVRKEPRMS